MAKSKLNSTEKTLKGSDVNHDEFNFVSNKEQNCFMLKESIRAEGDQLGDTERNKLKNLVKELNKMKDKV